MLIIDRINSTDITDELKQKALDDIAYMREKGIPVLDHVSIVHAADWGKSKSGETFWHYMYVASQYHKYNEVEHVI